MRTGQHPKAIKTLTDFLNDQPGYPEGVLLLVESLDATGEDARASAVLEPLVRDEPDLARARSWLAFGRRVGASSSSARQSSASSP